VKISDDLNQYLKIVREKPGPPGATARCLFKTSIKISFGNLQQLQCDEAIDKSVLYAEAGIKQK
jgi:hypothetical protein